MHRCEDLCSSECKRAVFGCLDQCPCHAECEDGCQGCQSWACQDDCQEPELNNDRNNVSLLINRVKP